MTEQMEEKATGADPEKAGVAESVGEPENSAPETTVPDETEQSDPAKPGGGAEQDHQPPAPVSEAALRSEPASVPEVAPVSASVPMPASEATLAPGPQPAPAPAPEAAPALLSKPASVPEVALASAPVLPPAPEAMPVPGPQPAPALKAPHVSGTAATPDPAPKTRRVLRATLRWTAALLTFAAFGAGSAYGIAGMERTDVPGLGTVSDGRWVYPVLTKAPTPSGSPGPLAAENKAGSHYADLRALVLPAPEGATVDKALSGTDGWLPAKDLLSEYAEKEDRDELGTKLSENGLRHIAARGWTTPDGTRTRIYLLQFDTAAVVDDLFGGDIAPYGSPGYELRDAPGSASDEAFPDAARIHDITASVYVESKPYGKEQARHAYIGAGDVLALVVQSRKGTANPVPFQQTVTLQSQLLG